LLFNLCTKSEGEKQQKEEKKSFIHENKKLLVTLDNLGLKLLKTILSVILSFIVLLGISYPSLASDEFKLKGMRDINFLSSEWRCPSPGNYLPDYTCDFDFEQPVCYDLELIQHIGQDNELKLKAHEWQDFSPIQCLERIKSFPILKPITFVFPDYQNFQKFSSPRLSQLREIRK
jgi:hypothetical protein